MITLVAMVTGGDYTGCYGYRRWLHWLLWLQEVITLVAMVTGGDYTGCYGYRRW